MVARDPARAQKHPILSRVLLAVASCLLSLVLAELVVRVLFRYNTPATLDAASLKYEPSLFSRHLFQGGQEVYLGTGWDSREDAADEATLVRINRYGFRGDEISLDKPAEAQRVIVIGGSAVFDIHASSGTDWPHLTESKLRDRGWDRAEVLNGGIPGHASFDALGRLYSSIWLLDPDYVVLNNAWNDIKYFTLLSRDFPLSRIYKPYVERSDPLRAYQGPIDRLLCHSQLYVKLRTRYWLSRTKRGTEGAVKEVESVRGLSEFAKKQYEGILRGFVSIARVLDIEPILMTQPTLIDSDNSDADRSRIAFEFQGLSHDQLLQAFEFCNETIREVASEMNVILVDADSVMSGRSEYFADHVHTTTAGSKELARLLATTLESALEARDNRSRPPS